jgi:hypothetical protein
LPSFSGLSRNEKERRNGNGAFPLRLHTHMLVAEASPTACGGFRLPLNPPVKAC